MHADTAQGGTNYWQPLWYALVLRGKRLSDWRGRSLSGGCARLRGQESLLEALRPGPFRLDVNPSDQDGGYCGVRSILRAGALGEL